VSASPFDEDLMVEIPDWALDLYPRNPGHGFVLRPQHGFALRPHPGIPYRYEHVAEQDKRGRMLVICTAAVEADGKRWMHVSFSRPNTMPSWADASRVKRVFVGADRKAIQVHPPESEYVSDHPFCLHWWSCLDGDGLPDFRHKGTI